MRLHVPLALCLALHAGLALAQTTTVTPLGTGLDRAGFDTSVRPQDDLFRAVNGQWLKDTPIPADKSGYGTFIELRDRADERVKKIVEELAATASPAGSNEQKIGAYYRSYIDEAAIDKAGLAPLEPWLAELDAVNDKTRLAALMGRWQGRVDLPLGAYVQPDPKEPGVYRALVWQGGLGLPDRGYYLEAGDRYAKAREAYLGYVQTLLSLQGDRHAVQHARRVVAFEKRLAQGQWAPVDNRDAVKTYNPSTVPALTKSAPGLAWDAFFKGAELTRIDHLSISQPSYARVFARLAHDAPLADWKLYLRVRLLDGGAQVLPKPFRDAHFAFHGKAIQGSEQPTPRWQRATAALNGALGEAVGQVYVARYFPPANKARMQQLVDNLLAAYGQSIDGLTWMSPETKLRAKDKLAKYGRKIGYPDKWRDYSALEVRDGDAFGNDMRAGRFDFLRLARRVGQPVDRSEWAMTPQTVNAYYSQGRNEIVFPAAILEPPFFDMSADDAANYGAIGAVIGHEISHGFDDQGSQYDGDGKLSNWWTPADRKAFDALGDRLVAQYSAYEPLPGQKLNGRLTLGENIADLSGLQIAYKAYRMSLKGEAAPTVDGLSGDQRFFMAWAQAWRFKMREARALQLLTIDPHSPPEFRANGSAVNHDAFHQAFGTHPGDGMYKPADERIRIW
ncbi:MAG: M13 family metallopeptidase [Rhizobacter sp.]|nr:M13 family metallopeptidase [Rhizobacter sp.]